MKKRIISVFLLSVILTTGCSKEDTSIPETQEPLIYVERDDLLYGREDELETEREDVSLPSSEQNETSESTPTTTTTTTYQPESNEPDNNKPNTSYTPSADDTQHELPEGIYETTVTEIIDTKASFGDIKVEYTPDVIEDEEGIAYGGVSTAIRLGANNYGSWRYVLFDKDEFLPVSGEENRNVVLIDNSSSNGLSFAFNGAAHNFKGNESNKSTIFLEIEETSGIASAKRAAAISTPEAFQSVVKGIASILGEFTTVDEKGHAAYHPSTDVVYEVKLSNSTYSLRVGCPYQELVDLLGEGNLISDEEHTYYAYKTDDYTLVVEKTEYPDIKPSRDLVELGVSENTVLISSIYLIKNEVTLPKTSDEG